MIFLLLKLLLIANAVHLTKMLKRRAELIKLSEDAEIEQSVKVIRKASEKTINTIYAEYEAKQADKANSFLTDMLISRFSDLLGGLDAIENSEELDKNSGLTNY